MTDPPAALVFSCQDRAQARLYLEPWGAEYRLIPGTRGRVITEALRTGGDVEVVILPEGVSLCISSNDAVLVVDGEGFEKRF